MADQLFVKYDAFGDVDDILVLEDKLSRGTDLTDAQKGALKSSNYRVRSQKRPYSEYGTKNELKYNENMKFSNSIQWYKVHDGSSGGNVIEGILNIK